MFNKHWKTSKRVLVVFITLILVVSSLSGLFAYRYGLEVARAQSASLTSQTLSGGVTSSYSYIIWTEGGYYYAKDAYGAIPSWGSSTAFSTVVNSALGSANDICVSTGSYTLNANISISRPIKLSGAGKNSTLINLNGYSININADNCEISSLVLNGTDTEPALVFNLNALVSIRNVNFKNCLWAIYNSHATATTGLYDSDIQDCEVQNCINGIEVRRDQLSFIRVNFRLNERAIVFSGDTELNPTFLGCVWTSNDYDFDVSGYAYFGAQAYGCWFEREGEATGIAGSGNLFYKGAATGESMRQGFIFRECRFSETTSIDITWLDTTTRGKVRIYNSYFFSWDSDIGMFTSGVLPYVESSTRVDSLGTSHPMTMINSVFTSAKNLDWVLHGLMTIPNRITSMGSEVSTHPYIVCVIDSNATRVQCGIMFLNETAVDYDVNVYFMFEYDP